MALPNSLSPSGYSLPPSLVLASPFSRNYVFQRRFVQFNGRSLMYFGSDKVGGLGGAPRGLGRRRGRAGEAEVVAGGHHLTDASIKAASLAAVPYGLWSERWSH